MDGPRARAERAGGVRGGPRVAAARSVLKIRMGQVYTPKARTRSVRARCGPGKLYPTPHKHKSKAPQRPPPSPQCFVVLCGALRCFAVLCGALRCFARLCGALRCSAVLRGALRCFGVNIMAWHTCRHTYRRKKPGACGTPRPPHPGRMWHVRLARPTPDAGGTPPGDVTQTTGHRTLVLQVSMRWPGVRGVFRR